MIILISEDDTDVRIALESMLKEQGAIVYSVDNGEEALEKLKAGQIQFDILVTDFNMPGMNGNELIREILNENIYLKKIIIMSGDWNNFQVMEELAREHSNVKFLLKPMMANVLIKAIF